MVTGSRRWHPPKEEELTGHNRDRKSPWFTIASDHRTWHKLCELRMVSFLSWTELCFLQIKVTLNTQGYTIFASHHPVPTNYSTGWAWRWVNSDVHLNCLEDFLAGNRGHLGLQMKRCAENGYNLVDSDCEQPQRAPSFLLRHSHDPWTAWQGQERTWSRWKHTGCRIRKPIWILSLLTWSRVVLGEFLHVFELQDVCMQSRSIVFSQKATSRTPQGRHMKECQQPKEEKVEFLQ